MRRSVHVLVEGSEVTRGDVFSGTHILPMERLLDLEDLSQVSRHFATSGSILPSCTLFLGTSNELLFLALQCLASTEELLLACVEFFLLFVKLFVTSCATTRRVIVELAAIISYDPSLWGNFLSAWFHERLR